MRTLLQENLLNILNETYYGKNEHLERIEEHFEELKGMIALGKNPNDSAPIKGIIEEIKALFNFQDVKFTIVPEGRYMNAFTYPIFWNYMRPSKKEFDLIRNKNGIRWKNSEGKTLYVYFNHYTLECLTKEEITGVLLHEIGHNFFLVEEYYYLLLAKYLEQLWMTAILDIITLSNIPQGICILIYIKKIQKVGLQQLSYEEIQNDIRKYQEKLKKSKGKDSFFGKIFKSIGILIESLSTLLAAPFILLSILLEDLLTFKQDDLNYQNEEFSDNFAASYGYATEVASVFKPGRGLVRKVNDVSNIPVIGYLQQVNNTLAQFLNISDCHPANILRCEKMLKKLEFELKNNRKELPAKEIKAIETKILELRKLLDEVKKSEASKMKGGLVSFLKKHVDKRARMYDSKRHDKTSEEDIFDFDKRMINDYITDESVNTDYYFDLYDEDFF